LLVDKLDALVRMLTAWSIESRAKKIKPKRGRPRTLKQRFPDAGRLGGAVGSSRSKAERIGEKEREKSRKDKGNGNGRVLRLLKQSL
jgi:hypothetical protein